MKINLSRVIKQITAGSFIKKTLVIASIFISLFQITDAQPARPDSSFGNNGIVRTEFGKSNKTDIELVQQVLQQDNNMYVRFNGNYITKRYLNGSADSSFGLHGFSSVIGSESFNILSEIAIQPDGKIVSIGDRRELSDDGESYIYFFFLMRYNPDGSIDSTFIVDKIQTREFEYPNKIFIQSDGKILAFGNFGFFRFNNDGRRDPTFTGELRQAKSSAVLIQSDNKILLISYNYNDQQYYDFAISRYNTDGSPDKSFSGDGRQETGFEASFINIQKDGKIVVGGNSTLSRYNNDGSPDNTFSGDGTLNTNFSISAMSIRDDGKILIMNGTGNSLTTASYNTDGSIDNSYSNKNDNVDFDINKIIAENNGEITVAGTKNGNLAIARYNVAGNADSTFGDDGKVYDSLVYSRSFFKSMAVHHKGKFAGVGFSYASDSFFIVQYNADGSLDKTFSGDGIQAIGLWGIFPYALSAAYQKDGKLVVGGLIQQLVQRSFIYRYNIDGTLDTSFNVKDRIDFNITSLAIQQDEKILVSGYKGNNPSSKFALARFNTDGTIDYSFSDDGKVVTAFNGNDYANSVVVQGDGKIVAGGLSYVGSNLNFALARYNRDGTLDNTFSNDGKQTSRFGSSYGDFINSVAIQTDGKIVAAGSVIARFNSDGSLDSAFRVHGQENTMYAGSYKSVVIQKDQKIIVGGDQIIGSAFSNFSLARFNVNGTFDSSFGVYGQISVKADQLNAIAILEDKLYAIGAVGNYYAGSGIVARYLLNDESDNSSPKVTLTIPHNIVKYTSPARIKLNATATDEDGIITKIQFYNGSTLLHTEDDSPYGFLWIDVPVGLYKLTVKAFDNSGNVTTSNSINVAVVDSNVAPVVSIASPANDTTFTSPATIRLVVNAHDPNDKIGKVEFYKGGALIRTEYYYPYTYTLTNVTPDTYTITAKAYDDKGLSSTSDPLTVIVTSASSPIVNHRSIVATGKTDLDDKFSITISPNPATNNLNIAYKGFQKNKMRIISIVSGSGTVLKTIHANASFSYIHLNVSSLSNGTYTIRIMGDDGIIITKKFVKLPAG